MKMRIKYIAVLVLASLMCINVDAQQKLTKDQIMSMSIEELSELPLEELMDAVETLGVSSVDELFALIMNKNVSSASKAEENAFTSPLSTTVITKDEMRTYGILSLEEAFRLIPGMIVTEKTPGNFDIQMRGLNNIPGNSSIMYTENANTLLMIDGRPMHNYGIAAITMDLMPISIEDVERIEVVRGACGALYGANAVSGVINIITEKPGESSKTVAGNIQMGNNSNMIGDIAIRNTWMDGKLSTGVTFNMQHRGRTTNLLPSAPSQSNRYYVEDDDLLESTRNMPVDEEGLKKLLESGKIRLAVDEEWMSAKDIDRYRNYVGSTLSNATEPSTNLTEMYDDPNVSRNNKGINGYISFAPSDGIRFDLTGGYHQSSALVSTVVDFIAPLTTREAKKGYVNLNSQIKNFSVNLGYNAGIQDYVKGLAGFKLWEQSFNANAEYTLKLGDLAIKPGVFYEWIKCEDYLPVYNTEGEANRQTLVSAGTSATEAYSWHYEKAGTKPAEGTDRLFGFFNTETHLYSVAPSLRLDYKIGDLRLIGAFRSDKTRIPDKWNSSWQFAANYSINDRNFIRFVYGRANRSCCLVNTSAGFQWNKTYMMPAKIYMTGNPDADLVHIDNFEIGYRWRPTNKILVDAEAFYSRSSDFGFLRSAKSMFAISGTDMVTDLVACATVLRPVLGLDNATMGGYVYKNGMETRTYLNYENVPFKANQMGLSMNVDYIISSKLIAKLNFNVQQTKLDDYYEYNKNVGISKQLGIATQELYAHLLSGEIVGDFFKEIDAIIAETGMDAQTAVVSFFTNPQYIDKLNKFGQDHAIKHQGNDFYFGSTNFEEPPTENGVKHEATPSVYGMLGLIYKPIDKLNIAAFGNFVGKRTFKTGFGEQTLDNRCTVNVKIGYKPMQNFEFFMNAHNLFNTEKQEFIYSDKIGGTYTLGINFGF
ncbi:MAG: TonB-dependent receptor [Bacteroidales bacterium]|nr:TonB-dependent receptor [Bacteroidales bacterium]